MLGRDINLHEVAATSDAAVYLYDKTLDVTWLRNSFGNGASSPVNWNAASAWAANLVTGSGGNAISDWRLPTMAAPALACNFSYGGTNCGFNPATSSSEMASLFYSTLGNKAYYDTNGDAQAVYGLTNTGSFQNMQSGYHWLGTEYAPSVAGDAWYFVTNVGNQSASSKNSLLYAMAVHSGDVMAPVPEPETYAMLLAGLGVIGAVARRRKLVAR